MSSETTHSIKVDMAQKQPIICMSKYFIEMSPSHALRCQRCFESFGAIVAIVVALVVADIVVLLMHDKLIEKHLLSFFSTVHTATATAVSGIGRDGVEERS